MKKKIYKEAIKKWNEMLSLKVYVSFKSVLETMHETASNKKNYERCYIIQGLIIDEISS